MKLRNKIVYLSVILLFSLNVYSMNYINVSLQKELAFRDDEIISDAILVKDRLYILESRYGVVKSFVNYRYSGDIRLEDSEGSIGITLYNGNYYVPIPTRNKINIYNGAFKKIREIKIQTPTDIECFKSSCYIVSNKGHRIVETDLMGSKIIREVGKFGFNQNEFRFPFDLTINDRGDLFISEVINTRVQIMNSSLKFVDFIGEWGVEKGQFYRPKGVAIYGQKFLAVSDGYIGVIQLFDIEKRAFSGVIAMKNNILRFESPTRIRIMNNLLFVIDYYAKKIFVYKFA